ncbi:hypothetical protein GMI68_09115 [Eggerthellaceae bacterium zg-886]|uniref:GIY-YIG nuclease family protein n=1 Tax=Xiamenia xianingshaonis TaxID=2682776 RepID=A0A9E6MP38_9ACTN|nr:hypothetical protein [Xiamenia xianingshaonis]QTU83718.1 GIY-YIG nuclease family protein [Xiamenia xianingshaonis]
MRIRRQRLPDRHRVFAGGVGRRVLAAGDVHEDRRSLSVGPRQFARVHLERLLGGAGPVTEGRKGARDEGESEPESSAAGSYWVYVVECADGTLYTGYTTDVERRVQEHNSGQGAKYTRSRRPVSCVHAEELPDKSAALRREAAVKRMTRAAKLRLIGRR